MAPIQAFQAVAPALHRRTELSSARALCSPPTTCCKTRQCALTGCPRASLVQGRQSFLTGGTNLTLTVARQQHAVLLPLHSAPRRSTVKAVIAESRVEAGSKVLAQLLKENAEFAAGRERTHKDVIATRDSLVNGQAPQTAVIACADSRVAPEFMFRADLGDLFVMRVAGNTAGGTQVMGSLQYGIDVLGVKLVMVLGHTNCGAVGAACARLDLAPVELRDQVSAIASDIDTYGGLTENVNLSVEHNIRAQVAYVREDFIRRGIENPPLIVGCMYDLATGVVSTVDADVPAAMGA